MPKAGRPFARVYWEIVEDPKFDGVWGDEAALGTWVKLLIIGEQSWPLPAQLYAGALTARGVPKAALAKLVEKGLVDLLPDARYRIHGLDAERSARSEQARAAVNARADRRRSSDDPPTPDGKAMEPDAAPASSGEPSPALRPYNERGTRQEAEAEAEAEAATPTPSQQEPDVLDGWYQLTGSWPSPKVIPWLEDLARQYGEEATIRALGAEASESLDRRNLLSRTRDRLGRTSHFSEKQAKAEAVRKAREAAEAERQRIEAMPLEQRRANLARLRAEMVRAGLMSEGKAAELARGQR